MLAIIKERMREIEGGVIKGLINVQRRRVRVGAVLSVLGGVRVEITISGASFGLLIVVMVLVSSMDGRVASEGFWTHGCGFLAAI